MRKVLSTINQKTGRRRLVLMMAVGLMMTMMMTMMMTLPAAASARHLQMSL